MPVSASEQARGREADAPTEIPPRGWRDIALRVKEQVQEDSVSLLAAGVAFYGMLALFPAMAAFISLYGLMTSPAEAQQQLATLTATLPPQVGPLIRSQLESIVQSASTALTTGFVVSLLGLLWSASKGTQGLIRGLNIAYDERENRGFLRIRLLALALTLGGLIFTGVALAAVAVLPVILTNLGLGTVGEWTIRIVRWPLLALLLAVALAVVYRYGPNRDEPKWRWVSPGAAIALVLWLLGSFAFSIYINNFGNYNETYGAFGAIIILLLWLFLSSFVVLLGAEINAEIEHQTRVDTTEGAPRPMGRRDAYVADHLGEIRSR